MEIKRDFYLEQLKKSMHINLIKVITGVRRCGKSYLLSTIFYKYLLSIGVNKDHIINIPLDARSNKKLCDPDKLCKYVKDHLIDHKQYYVLLDEIQMVPEFESVLNEFLHIDNADVYVTGSNSKFLSSDIITEFRGRSLEIRVRPLSFSEFHTASQKSVEEDWSNYLIYGGMPFLFNFSDDAAKVTYLKALFAETYFKDIIERNHLREDGELDELTNFLASAIGSLTNPAKLEKTFKSSKKIALAASTIRKYISYLQNAFIIEEAKRYDIKGKRYINTPMKYYFVDSGLRNARLNFRQIEESHLMENIIYNELLSMGYSIDVGVVDINTKDANKKNIRKQLEIDFVLNLGSKRIYVQSALSMETQEKYQQESFSLKKLDDSFKKVIIIGGYHKPNYTDDGFVIIGLFNFLLNPNIINVI